MLCVANVDFRIRSWLALPREQHDLSNFNGLGKGLGEGQIIELHRVLREAPKPFFSYARG
jgi:hypothetical protein